MSWFRSPGGTPLCWRLRDVPLSPLCPLTNRVAAAVSPPMRPGHQGEGLFLHSHRYDSLVVLHRNPFHIVAVNHTGLAKLLNRWRDLSQGQREIEEPCGVL